MKRTVRRGEVFRCPSTSFSFWAGKGFGWARKIAMSFTDARRRLTPKKVCGCRWGSPKPAGPLRSDEREPSMPGSPVETEDQHALQRTWGKSLDALRALMSLESLCLAGFRHALGHLSRAASVLQTLAIVGVLHPWEKVFCFRTQSRNYGHANTQLFASIQCGAMLALWQHVLFSLVLALQGLTLWLFFVMWHIGHEWRAPISCRTIHFWILLRTSYSRMQCW